MEIRNSEIWLFDDVSKIDVTNRLKVETGADFGHNSKIKLFPPFGFKMAGEKLVLCDLNKLATDYPFYYNPIFDDFSLELAEKIWQFHQTIPGYKPTPMVDMKNMAKNLNVGKLWTKDESKRFDLNAYKFLGVSYSLALELAKDHNVKGIFLS